MMVQILVVNGRQLARVMKVCRMLNKGSGHTVTELQNKLKASRRTIFRVLTSLEETGINVDLNDNGYRVRQSPAACKKLLADCHTKALQALLSASLK